jgi:oligopeptide transport system ATP-binding protein
MTPATASVTASTPLLTVRRLRVEYPVPAAWPWQTAGSVRAVRDIDFNLFEGETLGIVGESGCGKSTLARALIGLQKTSQGAIEYRGVNLASLDDESWLPYRRDLQMVFQDPLASLNPRMTVGQILAEALQSLRPDILESERAERASQWLERVGLSRQHINRYPHEFSGGQCQRVGIARALIVEPKILICDEAVSALDVSVQAQIINLLMRLQRELGLSMVFIAHDLAVVRHISQRIMVMYLGRVMETGAREAVFAAPAHPYTRALLAAAPAADLQKKERPLLTGEIPSPANPPVGCVFRTRCPLVDDICGEDLPPIKKGAEGQFAACHFVG